MTHSHPHPLPQAPQTSTSTTDILSGVGPRLRALRVARGLTLAELATETGISLSTLSRLESGQRRPALELLLPLAQAHGVPLDDMVGAPATGDPRIHLKPVTQFGQTIVPLSRGGGGAGGGVQAFKHVIAAGTPEISPTTRTHEGFDWFYVLRGRLRLILGTRDFVLVAGEAAEFDTRTPHWFGRADHRAVEYLSLFGRYGERMHVRNDARSSGAGVAATPD